MGLGVLGAIAGLWILHRVALALEDRGYIYYRRARGRAALGAALSAAEAHLRPQVEHVSTAERAEPERDEVADPPEPASGR